MDRAETAVSVRRAGPRDLAELDALFARSYPKLLAADYPPSILVTAVPIIARAQPALLASGTFFAAELGGRIVGAGGFSVRAPGTDRRTASGHIRHVVADATLTRRGIGRAVLARCIAEARGAELAGLHCLSTRNAVPFYAALGFATLGETVVSLGPGIGFPAIEMWRDL